MVAMAVGAGCGAAGGRMVGLRVEQLEDALGRRHGALQDVVLLAEVLNRPEESQAVLQERHQHAERQSAAFDAQAAVREDGRQRQHGDEFHHRVEPAIGGDGVLVGVHVIAIDAVEFHRAAALAIEELQHDDPGDVLLQVGVDAGDGHADAAIALLHGAAEDQRRNDDQRHGRHQDAGERRAHAVHDGDDEAEHRQVAKDGHQAGGEEVVEHVDVGGHARYQAADGIAIVEGEVEALQVLHELLAEVEHGELPGPLHEHGLGELGDEGGEQHAGIEECDARQAAPGVGGQPGVDGGGEGMRAGTDVLVDGQAGEQRIEDLQDGLQEEEQQRKGDEHAIGPHVAHQPAHQTPVICFTKDLFFHCFSG